jgi:hypothetical protein
MMIRTVLVSVLLGSAQASRIQVQEHNLSGGQTQNKFGATCEELQDNFHGRVAAIQSSLDGVDETSELSSMMRTRLTIRMHGIIRTLRRARECSWVLENNSEDLVQMRGLVQQFLAGNPCAEAARVEMQQASEEHPEGISRAMGILLSDDCEAPTPQEITPEELEDEVQEGLDELTANSDESAFMEMDKTQRAQLLGRFLRGVAVIFLMLFLVFACVSSALIIGWFVGLALLIVLESMGVSLVRQTQFWYPARGAFLLGAVGLPVCLSQVASNLLPALQ